MEMGQARCLAAGFILLDQRLEAGGAHASRDQLVYLAAVLRHRGIVAASPEASVSGELDVHLARACIHLVDMSARTDPGSHCERLFHRPASATVACSTGGSIRN